MLSYILTFFGGMIVGVTVGILCLALVSVAGCEWED